ncbi:hypothetical protein [Fibrivirga algicola]|uniref:Uncharacterized protein n=1 Tax=Fibrivirga algicola TaxID=2950420 RepID=A0ABX0QRK3_9BACT|nr:hypothetical protein [Fibrivirga algicola]NID13785.1 hypothetical protein [Fibrivirga algicola]
MHTFSLRLPSGRLRHYKLPACWEDLTPKQWGQVEHVLHQKTEHYAYALLMLWSGLTLGHLEALTVAQKLELLELLRWLDTPPTKWMRGRVNVRFRHFWGPGDGLEDLTFGGFLFAEAALKRYTDGEAEALYDLVAAVDISRKWSLWLDGPPDFNSKLLPQIAGLVKKHWAGSMMAGLHYNYVGARTELIRLFPGIFKPAGKNASSDNTWLDVGLSLARQTGALGTYAQLEQTNVYLVLTTLQALIEEADKLKDV